LLYSKNSPGAPPPATAGGKKLQSTKKNSAKLRVNSFTPRLKNACGKKLPLQQPNTPKATPMGTRMTRIQRISADQIRENPLHPRSHIILLGIANNSGKA